MLSCTCADRILDEEIELRGEPVCVWLFSPRGFYDDGSVRVIYDEPLDRAGTACQCLDDEEFESLGARETREGWPPPGSLLEEFNEVAYEECKQLAGLHDFVDDECREYDDAGTWLKDIYRARGSWTNGPPAGFSCASTRGLSANRDRGAEHPRSLLSSRRFATRTRAGRRDRSRIGLAENLGLGDSQ